MDTKIIAEDFLSIVEAPLVAPLGKVNGTITGLAVEAGTDGTGKAYKRLKLVGQLEAKNDAGQPFEGTRVYNLLGRGAKDFCKEVGSFTGTKIGTNDLRKFNKALLINQPATFEVRERREGKKSVSYFAGFFPISSAAITQQ